MSSLKQLVCVVHVVVMVTLFHQGDGLNFCSKCILPKDFCDDCMQLPWLPEAHDRKDIPQFIMFTYTGSVSSKDQDTLKDLFPNKLKNTNGCPISMTAFVVSEGSDECAIHRLYYAGHEIALSGINRTQYTDEEWTQEYWHKFIADQRRVLNKNSSIPYEHMVGMRAQDLITGSDKQYKMLKMSGFLYDSTLIAPAQDHTVTPWPFSMDQPYSYENTTICGDGSVCPLDSHPAIWQIPVIPLETYGQEYCNFLDQCFSDFHSSDDVRYILQRHLNRVHTSNRAPILINLRHESLSMSSVIKGLKTFISDDIFKHDDTWVVTVRDVVKWMKKPRKVSYLRTTEEHWACSDHRDYLECTLGGRKNRIDIEVTFSGVLDIQNLWIYQTIVLILVYIMFWKYDKKIQRLHEDYEYDGY